MALDDADWSVRAARAAVRAREARERAEHLHHRAEQLHAGMPTTEVETREALAALDVARERERRSRDDLTATLRRTTSVRATDAVDALLAPWPDPADETALRHRRSASAAAAQVVRHEIRTPLTKIICHVDLLATRAEPLATDVAQSVEVIAEASSELSDVLVAISRLLPGEGAPPS